MPRRPVDKRTLSLYGDYAFYHPDTMIMNREVSKNIIGPDIVSAVEYNAGKRIGKLIADGCKRSRSCKKMGMLSSCIDIIEKSGWGKIHFDESNATFRVYHSAVSEYYSKHVIKSGSVTAEGDLTKEHSTNESCIDDMLRGILCAVYSESTGTDCDVEETMCITKGDEYCEFKIVDSTLWISKI